MSTPLFVVPLSDVSSCDGAGSLQAAFSSKQWGAPVESTRRAFGSSVWKHAAAAVAEVRAKLWARRWSLPSLVGEPWPSAHSQRAGAAFGKLGWAFLATLGLHFLGSEGPKRGPVLGVRFRPPNGDHFLAPYYNL